MPHRKQETEAVEAAHYQYHMKNYCQNVYGVKLVCFRYASLLIDFKLFLGSKLRIAFNTAF